MRRFNNLFWDPGVNYDGAQTIRFGNGLGCTFSSARCSSWPKLAQDRGFVCWTEGAKGCTGNDHAFKGYCNIVSYSSSLPSQFQYFSSGSKGGSDQTADFCPYMSGYSNGDCRLQTNAPSSTWLL